VQNGIGVPRKQIHKNNQGFGLSISIEISHDSSTNSMPRSVPSALSGIDEYVSCVGAVTERAAGIALDRIETEVDMCSRYFSLLSVI